ncbi:hypothetical protein PG985_009297 [Apiospora marii]|uniref:Uncharacterized protein n=1 Tax=Apiospora marii TaxID=335849 RepID=A0ABR1RA56_9PEZI
MNTSSPSHDPGLCGIGPSDSSEQFANMPVPVPGSTSSEAPPVPPKDRSMIPSHRPARSGSKAPDMTRSLKVLPNRPDPGPCWAPQKTKRSPMKPRVLRLPKSCLVDDLRQTRTHSLAVHGQ